MKFLTKAQVTVLSDRRKFPPYGLSGGQPGALGLNIIIRKDGRRENLPSKFTTWVEPGDTVSIQTPGGGGWGK
jgi:N-methylhydantoinase B/oxoprolinase/acetone carboxylase alpha subunit